MCIRDRNKGVGTIHRALQVVNALVYIGFGEGLKDPNFEAVRSWVEGTVGPTFHTHYRLCLEEEVEQLNKASGGSIVPVPYGRVHGDLVPFLEELARRSVDPPPPPPPPLWVRWIPFILIGLLLGSIVVWSWWSSLIGMHLDVLAHYDPSGLLGDVGDIKAVKREDAVVFTYKVLGQGPHEWDWKYVDMSPNPEPARFGGVMLLNPPNNWGVVKDGGVDLRRAKRVSWRACSLTDTDVYVEFLIGGVNWQWNAETKTKEPAPYPDSAPRTSLGTKTVSYTHLTLPTSDLV